jgi:hypothetical protein
MRVAWLTAEYFLDTDEQMVPILQDRFEISWIIHGKKSTVGTSENVARVRTVEVVEPSYRARDPRLLMEFLGLVLKLRKLKPDVVYLGLVGLPHFHFLADLLLPKAKVICAVHNVDDYPGWGSRRWMRFYMRRMFKRFQHFHLFSKHTQESFLRQFPGKSTFQVPMALKSCGAGVRHRDDAKVRVPVFRRDSSQQESCLVDPRLPELASRSASARRPPSFWIMPRERGRRLSGACGIGSFDCPGLSADS